MGYCTVPKSISKEMWMTSLSLLTKWMDTLLEIKQNSTTFLKGKWTYTIRG